MREASAPQGCGDSRRRAASTGLREHLRWFDSRPLFGKRVLVTRPREQAAELVDLLAAYGAESVEAPMIRMAPPEDPDRIAACRGQPRTVRLDRFHQRECRRRVHDGAARRRTGRARAERTAHLHVRHRDGRQACPLWHQSGFDSSRVSGRCRRGGPDRTGADGRRTGAAATIRYWT